MHSPSIDTCPNCAAPLGPNSRCTNCGAAARGFFANLDLGRVELARAIEQGLDFYMLLQVTPETSPAQIRAAYHRLRKLFPEDTSRLIDEQRRRLELLEQAWYTLGDPQRRRLYDELRQNVQAQRNAPPDLLARGMACLQAGQFDDAARLLRSATQRNPSHVEAQIGYSLSLLYGCSSLAAPEDWRVAEMIRAMEQAIHVEASVRIQAHLALARALDHYDRYVTKRGSDPTLRTQALAQLDQAMQLLPKWTLPLIVRAHWYLHEQDLGSALAWAERARRSTPNDPLLQRLATTIQRIRQVAPAMLPVATRQAALLLADGSDPASLEQNWGLL